MKLLIVEDDKPTIQTYIDNIESFNKKSPVKIEFTIKENMEDAKKSLLSPDFDGAIIDLKLSSTTTELEGLKIVEEIENNQRFPIYIVSGSIAQIEKEETAFLKKRNRDTSFQDILAEIIAVYNTGITKILGKKGEIDKYLNNIFWKHLSNSLDLWINDKTRSPEDKQKSLLRYTLSHLQEYLEITEDSDFENYHPSEIYITPVIKPRVFTGDIVMNKTTKTQHVILTPSCDLAQSKAKDILLVNIEPSNTGILGEKISFIKKGKGDQNEASDILRKIIHNSFSNKYHFLPKYNKMEGGLINFQKVNSIRAKDFDGEFVRIASINGNFTKDIVARFSYYYSRQGSPDFVSDEIYNSLF
ncbi:MAG: hypothetical protein ACJATI_001279 [Halioglobus sp.]|jgi:hypothetical protein